MGDKVKNFFSKYVVPWAMRTQIDPEGVLPYTGEIVDAKLAGNHEGAQELEKKQNKLQGNAVTLIGTVAAQATPFAPLVNTAWGIHGVHDIKKDIDEDGKINPLRVAADLMMVKGGLDSVKEAVVPVAKSAIAEYLLKKGVRKTPYNTNYIIENKPSSNIEIVKRQARSGPETVLYEDVDNPNIYIAKEEDLGRVWAQKLGKDDAGAGYVAWHADPAGDGSLTAAQRDNLIEALIENTEPGTIISASGKSPQGMLAYGAMAKKYPNKFQLVQFDGENLPYIESEIDFPWKYWTSDMTLEQKLNILNKKRTAFGMPEGTIQDGQMVFPWIGLKRLKKGGSVESGIHIKPENKGKFTETKKRTGKTTEELTHSKNPLTRKRAIFAQNAKKWKH